MSIPNRLRKLADDLEAGTIQLRLCRVIAEIQDGDPIIDDDGQAWETPGLTGVQHITLITEKPCQPTE